MPNIEYFQSTLEKKSASTLKLPQKVHRKGNVAIINQKITKMVRTNFNNNGRFRDLIFVLAPSEDQAALIFNYVYRHF